MRITRRTGERHYVEKKRYVKKSKNPVDAKKEFNRIAMFTPVDPLDLYRCENIPRLTWRYFVIRYMVDELGFSHRTVMESVDQRSSFVERNRRGGIIERNYQLFKNKVEGKETYLSPLEIEKRNQAVQFLSSPIVTEKFQNFDQFKVIN